MITSNFYGALLSGRPLESARIILINEAFIKASNNNISTASTNTKSYVITF